MTDLCPIARTRAPWGLFVGCAGLALISRGVYLLRPWDPDGAIFVYMGRVVAEGGIFWRDVVDNKLPSVGFLTSHTWRAFGGWWPGYILLQTAMSLLACLALGRAASRAVGDHARWPTRLFALVYLNLNTVVFGGFQLETIHVFFAALAAMAAMNLLVVAPAGPASPARGRDDVLDALVVGLCAGCAALAKPTGLSVLAAAALAVLFQRRNPMRLLRIAAGMAAGVGIVAGVLWIYLTQTGTITYLPSAWSQIRLYAANSATDLRDLNKLIWAAGVLGFPILARWWVGRTAASVAVDRPAAALTVAGVPATGAAAAGRAGFGFAWLWLGIELAGVVLQKRMYGYHFLVLAPAAALIFGMLARPVMQRGLALALAPAVGLSILGIGQVVRYSIDYQRPLESARWLAARAAPGDRVWRDMTSRLLIETDLQPGSRYLLTFLFANADDAPHRYWAEMKADFDYHQPRWMVLPNDLDAYLADTTAMVAELERLPARRANYLAAWAEIKGYIHSHYQPVAVLARETVWERSDAAQRAEPLADDHSPASALADLTTLR